MTVAIVTHFADMGSSVSCASLSCSSVSVQTSAVYKVALKLPHGSKGVAYTNPQFQPVDLNDWLKELYAPWKPTGWICYNDDQPEGTHTSRGHCKGILTWDDRRIGWLIHSAPNFPHTFTGATLSLLAQSELIYGQSFLYVEQSRIAVPLEAVLRQILWMKPNIYMKHNMPAVAPYNSMPLEIKELRFSPAMMHKAKSPAHEVDYMSTALAEGVWHEESWKRGSEYARDPNSRLQSIETLTIDGTTFQSSQDHSKWAVTQDRVWIGDLNRMRSQEKRGGGGMVIHDAALATLVCGFLPQKS